MAVRNGEGWRTSPWKSPVPPKCRAVLGLRLPGASHYHNNLTMLQHHRRFPFRRPSNVACLSSWHFNIWFPAGVAVQGNWGSMSWMREVCHGVGADFESLKSCPTSCLLSALGLEIKMCTPSFSLQFAAVFLWLWPLTLCNCKPK